MSTSSHHSRSSHHPTLPVGHVIDGKYSITRVLGVGGMGVVYEAMHLRVRRRVAVKVLHAQLADAEVITRFEREAQAAGAIGSDHIVEVLDTGNAPNGDRYMVMEYLEGETLKQRLSRYRLPEDVIVGIVAQLLEGLAAAHAAGIIHRDLKPDNVFLQAQKAASRDWVKLLDFGISKFNALSGEEAGLTKTGSVMGTPFYMSPEQVRSAAAVDVRSDVYSVGVILYEGLTGQVPFHANTFSELMFKIVFETPPHPLQLNPRLDGELLGILIKAMDREPGQRFASAAAFRDALATWLRARGLLAVARVPAPGEGPAWPAAPTPTGATSPSISSNVTQRAWDHAGATKASTPSRAPWIIGATALLVGIAAGGLWFVRGKLPGQPFGVAAPATTSSASPPASAPAASASSARPAAVESAAANPSAEPAPSSTPSASAAATAAAPATPPPQPARGGGRAAPRAAEKAAPAPPTPPPPAEAAAPAPTPTAPAPPPPPPPPAPPANDMGY